MKFLVTGVTGLVGSHLVRVLNQHETVVVGRQLHKANLDENIVKVELDLTSELEEFAILDKYGKGWIWIHVAAAISGASEDILKSVNIEGTKKLVIKAKEISVDQFILISSISTYGTKYKGLIGEEEKQEPESYYGHTKLEQEKIVFNSGLDYIILRPPYIGGPGDKNFLAQFASRIEKQRMPTFSKIGHLNYIDARDLSRAILHLANSDSSRQVYNIISESLTLPEFISTFGKKLKVSPPYGPHYPYWLSMMVGFIGELKSKVTGNKGSTSRYRIRSLCRQFDLDISKLESTGFKSKYSLDQSLDDWISSSS